MPRQIRLFLICVAVVALLFGFAALLSMLPWRLLVALEWGLVLLCFLAVYWDGD